SSVDPILGLLHDDDAHVRRWAAYYLGLLGRRQAVEPLVPLLRDSDADVRAASNLALWMLGDSRASDPLVLALDDPDARVRYAAAEALTITGDASALPPLRRLVEREPPERSSAVLHPGRAAARAISAIKLRISGQQGASR